MLSTLALLEPMDSQKMSPSCFDVIADTLPITFEKNLVKLESGEFAIDDRIHQWVSLCTKILPL